MISYKNPSDPENIFLKAKLKEWLKVKLNSADELTAEFHEIPCGVDNCPCITTEMLITKPFYKRLTLAKPLVFIRKWDIDRMEIS